MELIICKNENEWVDKISQNLETDVVQYNAQRIFLPAGETPRPLYSRWSRECPPFLKGLKFMQVDEILDGTNRFQNFFKETLGPFQKQFIWIDQANGICDGALLGLGTNGHVAFHEPNLPKSFFSGCLKLDLETCERLKIPKQSRAVTYGLDAFVRSKFIYLIVRGLGKKEILKKVIKKDKSLPASYLMDFSNLKIFTDFNV